MLSPEVWAEVHRLHEDGVPIKQIARAEGLAPNTVRRLVSADEPPRYQRPPRGSLVEPFEARIVQLLREEPWLTAADIGRRVRWPASVSLLRAHVARLREQSPPSAPASARLPVQELEPGSAECGLWWPQGSVAVGYGQQRRCPVLLMVAGYSGQVAARPLVSARFGDVWSGHHRMLQEWGLVPHILRWDAADVVEPVFWGGDPGWSDYIAQAELGSTAVQFASAGRLRLDQLAAVREYLQVCASDRGFSSGADLEHAVRTWLDRRPAALPVQEGRWAADRAAMIRDHPQPPLLAAPLGDRCRRVPDGDGFVDVLGNGYLVGQWARGRRLTVEVTDTTVTVRSSGHHAGGFHTVSYARVWAEGVRVTVPVRHFVIEHGTRVEKEIDGP